MMKSHLTVLVLFFIAVSGVAFAQSAKQQIDFTISVNSKTGETEMTKEELINAAIGVHVSKDLEVSKRVTLLGFTFKTPGRPAVLIKGDTFTPEIIQWIKQSRVGDHITLYDPIFQVDGTTVKSAGKKSVIVQIR